MSWQPSRDSQARPGAGDTYKDGPPLTAIPVAEDSLSEESYTDNSD